MNCKKIKVLLHKYLDKELTNQQQVSFIETHLKTCTICQKEHESLVGIKNLIANKERLTADESFLEILKEKVAPKAKYIQMRWQTNIGFLAKRLIPVPVTLTILFSLFFLRNNQVNPVDEYLLADLTSSEMVMLTGSYEQKDLLIELLGK